MGRREAVIRFKEISSFFMYLLLHFQPVRVVVTSVLHCSLAQNEKKQNTPISSARTPTAQQHETWIKKPVRVDLKFPAQVNLLRYLCAADKRPPLRKNSSAVVCFSPQLFRGGLNTYKWRKF